MNSRILIIAVFLLFLLSLSISGFAQTGTISGNVKDKRDNMPLIGVNVFIQGTSIGTSTDFDGNYRLENVPHGQYNIEFSYLGYERTVHTGIRVQRGETVTLDITLSEGSISIDEEIVIVGERPLVDVNESRSQSVISSDVIEAAPVRQIQNLLNTQAGVVQNPEGLYIRGGRDYETGFYIDGVSARDPLAGTGFGLDLGTNAISNIEVTTGGMGVEYGNATSGIVDASTRSGGREFELNASYKTDNFGFNDGWESTFNTREIELGFGGPAKTLNKVVPGEIRYFTSFKTYHSDDFTRNPPDRLKSSIYPSESWSPRQDNRYSMMFNINYNIDSRKRLRFSYLKSLTINQNTNLLRITGNDVTFRPGYQYLFSLQPDNANTYTHDTNLQTLSWSHTTSDRFTYRLLASRLYVKLRADANGRDWRPLNVDSEFDPGSIVEFPTSNFNPDDSIVFVLPGPGLFNNNGIATLWHDHYVVEYTMRASGTLYSKDTYNRLHFGVEVVPQEMLWVDIIRPWIGAPVELADGSISQSFRLGDLSDVWKVNPLRGAIYASNRLRFRGLIAEIGARYEVWMPGKFVDDAINNPDAPIRDEIRESYISKSTRVGDRYFKSRLLPRVSASFPIRENTMMYFNYGHSTVMPHPSFIYTGLDPFFTDRSTLSRLGNPDLDPEVDISYEVGLRSQLTMNDAFNFTAFWRDKYDFITSSSVLIQDFTGRDVNRTIRINSDYARSRGIEISYIKRISRWFNGQISFSYSKATGQSSSSSETLQDILSTGIRETTRETPLAWDTPIDLKAYAIFTKNDDNGLFGVKALNKMSLYVEAIYRTGRRYTRYNFVGLETASDRPIYEMESDPEQRFSEIGQSLFWLNLNYRKWWDIGSTSLALTIEITNALNTKNAAIINPVTGRAYEDGDNVPTEWRDPRFNDPRDPRSGNRPPNDPSRFHPPRNIMLGLAFRL
ncbi:MAG: TonB-dependent receptor [Chitinophagaceae bacterium]|nr:MAG: TonB-dependent receptor [Chitinophagaceae bacterium]